MTNKDLSMKPKRMDLGTGYFYEEKGGFKVYDVNGEKVGRITWTTIRQCLKRKDKEMRS